MAAPKAAKKKKKNIKLPLWYLYITTSSNNTIITLTDPQGNKISGGWTGLSWFKGAKESTPFASETTTRDIVKEAKEVFWMVEVAIICKGLWLWRDWAFKAINDIGWVDILFIKEATWIQFGGCKWKRPKRN